MNPLIRPDLIRKAEGAYYTPPALALALCRRAIGDSGRILDPACGNGELLVAALRILAPADFASCLEIVEQRLFGVDLDSAALELARTRLREELLAHARTPAERQAAEQARFNLRSGNAILGPVDGTGAALREDIAALDPLDWHREFPEALGAGGFDVIVANPPWDSFKPNAREFFLRYSDVVTRKKMTLEQFRTTAAELLRDPEIQAAWLAYVKRYRAISRHLRGSGQHQHQDSGDLNLYKLFTERCFQLLRPGGRCALLLPGGFCNDRGARSLRELLFTQTRITELTSFENRLRIFDDVHRSFRFAVVSFEKQGTTETFPAALKRHDVSDMDSTPTRGAFTLSTSFIQRVSPDSLSIMELTSERDIGVIEKLIRHPRLGDRVRLTSELHMTADSPVFQTSPDGALPLYEGKMIWQFDAQRGPPRYWVDASLAGPAQEHPRLAIRAVASNTNERSLVAAIVPKRVFCGNSLITNRDPLPMRKMLWLMAVLNSFVADWFIRKAATANINQFYLYQLPIPEAESDQVIAWAEQLLGDCSPELRARCDAAIAKLYGIDEADLSHILEGFPIVSPDVKAATLAAFRSWVSLG